jgi:predicted nucleic acid-binding protein
MPDERREFHKIRPASHTLLSVNCLYQINTAEGKGVFTKLRRDGGNDPCSAIRNPGVCPWKIQPISTILHALNDCRSCSNESERRRSTSWPKSSFDCRDVRSPILAGRVFRGQVNAGIRSCVEALRHPPGPLFSGWPVITEAAWLLRGHPRAIQQLLGSLDGGFLELLSLAGSEGVAIAEVMKRYADIRPQLADAALVYLAEREGIDTIL